MKHLVINAKGKQVSIFIQYFLLLWLLIFILGKIEVTVKITFYGLRYKGMQ